MISLIEAAESPFFGIEIGAEAKPPYFLSSFQRSLQDPPSANPKYEVGRLLCSAIVNGALLDRGVWDAWVYEVYRFDPYPAVPWLDLIVADQGSPTGTATRRWFADPVSRALAKSWSYLLRAAVKTIASCGAEDCLREYLSVLLPDRPIPSAPGSDLLRWATLHWRLRMPALLIDQARGALPTVSLSTYDYLRLIDRSHRQADHLRTLVRQPSNPQKEYRAPPYIATHAWMISFRASNVGLASAFDDVMKLWRKGSLGHSHLKRQCIANLELAATNCTNTARIDLIRWCQSLLEIDRTPYKRGLSPYTVRLRLIALVEGVLGGTEHKTGEGISRKQVLLSARAALGTETCRTRRQLMRKAACDFSQFQKRRSPLAVDPEQEERDADQDAEALEIEDMERAFDSSDEPRGRSSVSANLLSSTDYLNAVAEAYRDDPSGELALVIMLGFRTGMRLREILGLETCDILSEENRTPSELHLRPNYYRELKTFASRRIIPLDLFLTYNEQRSLGDWLKPRAARSRECNSPLLVFGSLEATSMPDETLYARRIARILREACDKKFTFSHLRHSFASYLLLNLLLPDVASETLVPFHIRNLVTWDRKWVLQSSLLGHDRLGQSALHAVSQMMGHTGILRTLESYQHLLDLAVGLYVNRKLTLPQLPREVIDKRGLPPAGDDRVPASLGPSDYWRQVANHLTRLPSLTPDGEPIAATIPRAAKPGNWRVSRIRFANRDAALSESSSKIGWRLLLEILNAPDQDVVSKAATFGLAVEPLQRFRARHEQVVESAFTKGALPDGLTAPRGHQAEQIVETIWSKLPSALSYEESMLLQTFLNSFRSARYHGVFERLDQATAFAAFLRKIGFPADHIFIAAGPAALVQRYKLSPRDLRPERLGDQTLYRRPDDLDELARATLPGKKRRNPVVLWFRYIKYERDHLGLSFDTRYRLDSYQAREDEKLLRAGHSLKPSRLRAAVKRNERSELDSTRTQSTVLAVGNKAYRFSLLLAAIYYDIALDVEFPEGPHSGNLRVREQRRAKLEGRSSSRLKA